MMRPFQPLGALLLAGVLHAQAVTYQYRPLGPVLARSAPEYIGLTSVRSLSDGRVLVNDGRRRVVVALDSALRAQRVLLDSTAANPNISYGRGAGGLFYAPGDSSLFLDRSSATLLMLGPDGRIVRTLALPPGVSAGSILNSGSDGIALSSRYGVIYAGSVRDPWAGTPPSARRTPVGPVTEVRDLDSGVVLVHGVARTDTLTRIYHRWSGIYRFADGLPLEHRPLPAGYPDFPDRWAVTSDGSVAVLRGREYRIQWFGADGATLLSPRLPFSWKPMSAEDRVRVSDSLNAGHRRSLEGTAAASMRRPPGPVPRADSATMVNTAWARARLLTPDDMPDFWPLLAPERDNFVADRDNRVWVHVRLPNEGRNDGATYDIIDRSGIIDRVRLPVGTTLIGFGPGGIVYLAGYDAGRQELLKVRFR